MDFDFDQVIDRDGTAAIATDAWNEFLLDPEMAATLPPDADLLTMWVADMDFAAPPVAIEAIRERLDRKILGYTLDTDDEYRRVFAEWCQRRYGWSFDDGDLYMGRGVVPALVDLLAAIVSPGEKVMTLTPAYHWFQDAVDRQDDVELVTVAMSDLDGRATIDLERFEATAADPAVTVFFLCHPHNPNGIEWTVEELTAMGDVCRRHGVQIVSDEIHADLTRVGVTHRPTASVLPDDRVITCMAPSKTFNLAGLMFSTVVIPDPEIAERFDALQYGITNPLSLAAATAVHRDGDAWLDVLRRYLDDNLRYVADVLSTELPGASLTMPDATYLAWIDLGPWAEGIDDLTFFFAKEAHVLLEGPEQFVADGDRHVRLNIACPRSKVEDGMRRMIDALRRRVA